MPKSELRGQDGLPGGQGLPGLPGRDGADGAGVNLKGSFDTISELEATHPTGTPGDAFLVGGYLVVWDDENDEWFNTGQNIQGPRGYPGVPVMLRVENNVLQWQHQGSDTWTNLPLDFIDPRVAGLIARVDNIEEILTALSGLSGALSALTTNVTNLRADHDALAEDFDKHTETNVYVATI